MMKRIYSLLEKNFIHWKDIRIYIYFLKKILTGYNVEEIAREGLSYERNDTILYCMKSVCFTNLWLYLSFS